MSDTHFSGVDSQDGYKVGGSSVINSSGEVLTSALQDSPSHVVKFGANYTTTGGAAAEAITVTGALATDIPLVTLQDGGTSTVSIVKAVITENTLTVTFSANPGNDAVISYAILRATS